MAGEEVKGRDKERIADGGAYRGEGGGGWEEGRGGEMVEERTEGQEEEQDG